MPQSGWSGIAGLRYSRASDRNSRREFNALARAARASVAPAIRENRTMGTVAEAPRPTSKGQETRPRILDVAEEAILAKGFDATSIEEIVAGAEITRSGFFYHFPDKNELARALLERYIEQDRALLDDIFRRADELSDDPLHALPDRAQALRRGDGRPAERPPRLHRRHRLLPGAAVRRRGARR